MNDPFKTMLFDRDNFLQQLSKLPNNKGKIKLLKFVISIKDRALEDVVDGLVATYYESHFGWSPLQTDLRVPQAFMRGLESPEDFLYYVGDIYKICAR